MCTVSIARYAWKNWKILLVYERRYEIRYVLIILRDRES